MSTPQQIRAAMVASYLESYRRAGIEMSERDVERQVVADCELVDAARRSGDLVDPAKRVARDAPRASKNEVLEAAQRMTNTRLTKGAEGHVAYDRHRFMHGNPQRISARWGAACARISRILQGAGKASTITAAVAGAEHPELAREYMETFWYFTTRGQPAPKVGQDHNPFRGMNDGDAARAFIRRVEDICDRSTGVLGGWYTGVSETARAAR